MFLKNNIHLLNDAVVGIRKYRGVDLHMERIFWLGIHELSNSELQISSRLFSHCQRENDKQKLLEKETAYDK